MFLVFCDNTMKNIQKPVMGLTKVNEHDIGTPTRPDIARRFSKD